MPLLEHLTTTALTTNPLKVVHVSTTSDTQTTIKEHARKMGVWNSLSRTCTRPSMALQPLALPHIREEAVLQTDTSSKNLPDIAQSSELLSLPLYNTSLTLKSTN